MYKRIFTIGFLFGLVLVMPTGARAACDATQLGKVSLGDAGAAVTALQSCLLTAGYSIPAGVTGYYGVQTQTAVKAFYADALQMGEWEGTTVGPQGRAALAQKAAGGATTPTTPGGSLVTPPPATSAMSACAGSDFASASYGVSGRAVTHLQQCLLSLGFSLPAGATGYYGVQTQGAVQAFYRSALHINDWHGKWVGPQGRTALAVATPTSQGGGGTVGAGSEYTRVASADALRKYVERAAQGSAGSGQGVAGDVSRVVAPGVAPAPTAPSTGNAESTASVAADRFSSTNVQVAGIDEPDIVKTDGSNVYVSDQSFWYGGGPGPIMMMGATAEGSAPASGAVGVGVNGTSVTVPPTVAMPIRQDYGKTQVVKAFPLDQLGIASEAITEHGEMLLVTDAHMLIILAYPSVVGYDVSNPTAPVKKWTLSLGDNTSVVAARLLEKKLYLITQTWIQSDQPCPVVPIMKDGQGIAVPCADIWVPRQLEPANTVYTATAVDALTGTATAKLTVAGLNGQTTIALFPDNLYLATHAYEQHDGVYAQILVDSYAPYLSTDEVTHAKAILGYDISEAGKRSEIELLINAALATLTADARLKVQTDAGNTLRTMLTARMRDLDRTRIVRVALSSLTIAATGEVPGSLLNQFSLDEYNGNLRTAMNVTSDWGGAASANDVYVLNSDLAVIGSVTNLGLGERIYAARFIGASAYLVTFRQVDPFYVLDLSVPTAPKLAGTLKVPGYSAYLEPLGDNLVLGVGQEGNGVKLSVFDVTDPTAPVERAKYIITDSWSDVEQNHHAFLRDSAHSVFFLPGSQGGYVFSYAGGALTLKATVAGWSVKRAVYINNYLYVIGNDKITVFDEGNWNPVTTLAL